MWYNCGNGFVQTKWARSRTDLEAYLVCPGPSMRPVERTRGATVFAVNTAYPAVQPDMWIGMDKIRCYDPNILYEPFPKIFRGSYADMEFNGKRVADFPQTYFATVGEVEDIFSARAHNTKFQWKKHTLGVALHILVWMGYKTIHFVGTDLGGDSDYYYGSTLNESNRAYNRRLYAQQVDYLKSFAQRGVQQGIRCVSCTPNSPINKFMEYIPLDTALTDTEERHTYGGKTEIKHALDA